MKVILTALVLLCLAEAAGAETPGVALVGEDTHRLVLQPQMLYLPDPKGAISFGEAMSSRRWRPLPASNLGYVDYPVWTRITLRSKDGRSHRFILYNPRPGTNFIDAYVEDASGRFTRHDLGILRPVSNQIWQSRFSTLPVTVPADRPLTVYARVRSAGPLEVGWVLDNIGAFSAWSVGDDLLRGVLAGAVLTMVLYNLMLWLSLRQPLLLAYVAFGSSLLTALYSFQGVYRLFSFGLPAVGFFYNTWLSVCLMSASAVAIAIYFFETRKHMPLLHRWLQLLLAAFGLAVLWVFAAIWDNALFRFSPWMHLLLTLTYASLIFTGISGLRRHIDGAGYYLAGQGSLLVALGVVSAIQLGGLGASSALSAIIPLGALLDITFLAKAIGTRLGRMKRELALQRESTRVQARFAALGKTIGMITHQWRTPLARQGAALTEMELLLENDGGEAILPRIRQTLLPRMRESLDLLNGTVEEFRTYFAADNRPTRFRPVDVIEQTIALVAWQRQPLALEVTWQRPDDDDVLNGYATTFAHVVMIIVENAVDVFAERSVVDARLWVSLSAEHGNLRVAIADNGGGIDVRPLERVFSGFFSDKRRRSTGLGLYIARMLVEERLGGHIAVENTAEGACFSITLPLYAVVPSASVPFAG